MKKEPYSTNVRTTLSALEDTSVVPSPDLVSISSWIQLVIVKEGS